MGPRYCDHTFYNIKIDEVEKKENGELIHPSENPKHYSTVGCVFCGQVREIYDNGDVIIRVEEGKIIKKRNDQLNNTSQKI